MPNQKLILNAIDGVTALIKAKVPTLMIKFSMQQDPILKKHCDTIIRWAMMKIKSENESFQK